MYVGTNVSIPLAGKMGPTVIDKSQPIESMRSSLRDHRTLPAEGIFRLGCCCLFSFQTTTFYILSYRLSDRHPSVLSAAPVENTFVSALPGDLPKSLIRFRWMVNAKLASVWYSVGLAFLEKYCRKQRQNQLFSALNFP